MQRALLLDDGAVFGVFEDRSAMLLEPGCAAFLHMDAEGALFV